MNFRQCVADLFLRKGIINLVPIKMIFFKVIGVYLESVVSQ